MDKSRISASLAAAQDDVERLFEGFEVPAEYRTRLTAYIQCWYLDQGLEQGDGGARICTLHGEEPAAASRPA
jgi:hypothetical protein